jgi:hypothetical protein
MPGQAQIKILIFALPVVAGVTDTGHNTQTFLFRCDLENVLLGKSWSHCPSDVSLPHG